MKSELSSIPTITVLMSCYNAERWLDDAVRSVLNQTFDNFEFIIIDDGSVDGTLSLIRRYASADSRIIVVAKQNTGLSDSLNVGIKMARGKWIARLDADDICEPTRLEEQINLATSNSALVFIGTGLTIIDTTGIKQKTYSYPTDHAGLLRNLSTAQKFPPHASAMYRTDVVRSIGGYRRRIKCAEDLDLWLRLAEAGEIASLSKPLVQIRKHADQISHSEGGRRQILDSRMAIVAYWIRRFRWQDPVDDSEVFESFSSWIQARIEEAGVFDFQMHKSLVNHYISKALYSRIDMLRLIIICISKPNFMIRIIKERLFGESIGRQLALEWVKRPEDR